MPVRRRQTDDDRQPWLLRHSALVVTMGICATAAVAVVGIFFAPEWKAFRAPRGSDANVVVAREQGVRDSAIRLATGIGAATAGLLAWSRLELSRQEHDLGRQAQFTDRYTKAVEQLGHDSDDVRLGGLYALERLGHDSPRDRPTITEVLAAYVRSHTTNRGFSTDLETSAQAAMTILGRTSWDPADLQRADLTEVRLDHAVLRGADLRFAKLVSAELNTVDFTGSYMHGADLSHAYLTDVDLSDVDLSTADLTRASLGHAQLGGASLVAAKLPETLLTEAVLIDADMTGADLTECVLQRADMTGARLRGVRARRATFTEARLIGADLTDGKFTDASFVRADLTGATLDAGALVDADATDVVRPEGF